jgi:lipid-A-disaccharide synthase
MASRLGAALGAPGRALRRLGFGAEDRGQSVCCRRLSVWVFAGEPSGDAIGARALRALRIEAEARNDPVTSVEGVGGPAMLAAGLRASLFPMEDVSVMGVAEVAASLPSLRRRLSQAAAAVNAAQPDVLLTIDAKGFSFRLAKAVTNEGTTKVHVVSPSWWAWRGGERNLRALRATGIDAVACLLPFEPEGVRRAGTRAAFVGHPVVEDVREGAGAFREAREARRAAEARAGTETTVLGALPGSRDQELDRHLPLFREACAALSKRLRSLEPNLEEKNGRGSDLRVEFLVLPRHQRRVRRELETWPVPATATAADAGDCQTRASFFGATDAVLVAAGTATAQAFAHGVPQVVAYRAHFATEWIARALAKTPHASLPNVALPALAPVPELLGASRATPAALADAAARVLRDERARRAQTEARDAFLDALTPRDASGAKMAPSLAVARVALDAVEAKRKKIARAKRRERAGART